MNDENIDVNCTRAIESSKVTNDDFKKYENKKEEEEEEEEETNLKYDTALQIATQNNDTDIINLLKKKINS